MKKEARCKTYEGRLDFGPNSPDLLTGIVIAIVICQCHVLHKLQVSTRVKTTGFEHQLETNFDAENNTCVCKKYTLVFIIHHGPIAAAE